MKVFSLNVWFDNYMIKDRTILLIDYILTKDFDIITLQEVTPYVLSLIYKSIHEVYPHIHTDLNDEKTYGNCIMSKYEMKNKKNLKFNNTRMDRGLLICKIKNIIVSTSHFESEFSNYAYKKIDQFNETFKLLSKYDKVLFVGDTNLTKKNEELINSLEFADIYKLIDNSKENQYTYDGVKNPFLNNKIRSRVDRAYVKNIEPSFFDNEKAIIMSDHYGLLINI